MSKFQEVVKRWTPTIGIEVHVELGTKTKLFCSAPNPAAISDDQGDERPNTFTTPVSLGLPGALPVLNEKAVEYAIKIGLALNAEIAEVSRFARKNYFYPDLTKNYQTSQSNEPTVKEGHLDVDLENGETVRVEIERAHIEEDAGKNTHIGSDTGRIFGADHSLIDYNRAGVPLVEIVTKPIRCFGETAREVAANYVRSLRDIFKAIGVSNAKMEQGNLRADINVSIAKAGSDELGTRTETKNVNSFRSIYKAVEYEVVRQAKVLESGKKVIQETRHWKADTSTTTSGRVKSDSDDYRFFPEPNLVKIIITQEDVERIRKSLPELPIQKYKRLMEEWEFSNEEFRDIRNAGAIDILEETVRAGVKPATARKWLISVLYPIALDRQEELENLNIKPEDILELQELIDKKVITDKIARDVIIKVLSGKGSPSQIVKQENLQVMSDDNELENIVIEIMKEQKEVVEKLRSGNMAPIGVLIGQVMKATKGKADAQKVREIVMKNL
jgi:aspartyl-tRNA(Asn)/glutamyl-tRNA(Gln) amidotransferase subunit B